MIFYRFYQIQFQNHDYFKFHTDLIREHPGYIIPKKFIIQSSMVHSQAPVTPQKLVYSVFSSAWNTTRWYTHMVYSQALICSTTKWYDVFSAPGTPCLE